MKDLNRKCIMISLPASIWSHCFVGIEANSGLNVYCIVSDNIIFSTNYCCNLLFLLFYLLYVKDSSSNILFLFVCMYIGLAKIY